MKLRDLQFATKNAKKRTPRGRKVIASSLQQFGAGRSVLIDRDGKVIAGNKTAEQAAASGIEDVIVVQTDGLRSWRGQRRTLDPPVTRVGKMVLYSVKELERFMEERTQGNRGNRGT